MEEQEAAEKLKELPDVLDKIVCKSTV